MHSKPLTKIQQDWLDNVKQATEQNLSMSAYAKKNNLALKAFYNARSSLMQKGILSSISSNHLVPLAQSLASNPSVTTSYRITLCNGVIIELADVGISDLLNSANQL
jgi:hypothetical protein